jgi:hypothetical protein
MDNLRLIVAQKIERDINGKGRAFRSWCVFDKDFKDELFGHRHTEWSQLITQRMRDLGQTFAQQALPALLAGEISEKAFMNLSSLNAVEARHYIDTNGGKRADS